MDIGDLIYYLFIILGIASSFLGKKKKKNQKQPPKKQKSIFDQFEDLLEKNMPQTKQSTNQEEVLIEEEVKSAEPPKNYRQKPVYKEQTADYPSETKPFLTTELNQTNTAVKTEVSKSNIRSRRAYATTNTNSKRHPLLKNFGASDLQKVIVYDAILNRPYK